MAESDTTTSVGLIVQDESAGPAQPESILEQPLNQDSEPVAAVAVMDPPVTEVAPESAVAAEENPSDNPETTRVEEKPQESASSPDNPVEKATETDEKENNEQPQSIVIPTIPMRAAFLPVRSAQNHTGYALRGLL